MNSIIYILKFLHQTFENEFILSGSMVSALPSSAQITRLGVILDTRTTYSIAVRNPAMFEEYLDWQNSTQSTLETITWIHLDSRTTVRICMASNTVFVRTLPYSNEFVADLRTAAGNMTVSVRVIDPLAP